MCEENFFADVIKYVLLKEPADRYRNPKFTTKLYIDLLRQENYS